MKKILLASSALIAFGTMSAQAAEPIKLSLGGYMNQFFGYVGNQSGKDYSSAIEQVGGGYPAGFSATGTTNGVPNNVLYKPNKVVEHNDESIFFKGATKLDNGIAVSAEIDMNGSQGIPSSRYYYDVNKGIKKAFATVSGVFGQVTAGQQDNIGYLIHTSSPHVTQLTGQDGTYGYYVMGPRTNAAYGRTAFRQDQSTDKIIYVTPQFAGFSAGFSYSPTINQSTSGATAAVTSYDGTTPATAANGAVANLPNGDVYVGGLAYNHEIGKVALKADASMVQANFANQRVYQGGVSATFNGFTVGGSYMNRDTAQSSPNYVTQVNAKKGDGWDAGVGYAVGPYKVTANYFTESEANFTATTHGYDHDTVYALEGGYTMGPGVLLSATLMDVRYKDGQGRDYEKNRGTAFLTGINLSF